MTAGYTVACKRVTEGVGIALNVLHSFGNLQASLCYTRWQHFSAAPKNQTESSSGTIAGEQCLRRRCESIGCDEGRFTFPEECCLQPLPLALQRSVLAPGVTEECRLRLVSKTQNDCFCLCRALWFFRATKEHDRTTTRRITDNGLRVKATLDNEYKRAIL